MPAVATAFAELRVNKDFGFGWRHQLSLLLTSLFGRAELLIDDNRGSLYLGVPPLQLVVIGSLLDLNERGKITGCGILGNNGDVFYTFCTNLMQ